MIAARSIGHPLEFVDHDRLGQVADERGRVRVVDGGLNQLPDVTAAVRDQPLTELLRSAYLALRRVGVIPQL